MADTIAVAGAREWVVQRFRPEGCADAALCSRATAAGVVPEVELARSGLTVRVR